MYIHLAAGRLPSLSISFIFIHKYVLLCKFVFVLFVNCHRMSLLEPLPSQQFVLPLFAVCVRSAGSYLFRFVCSHIYMYTHIYVFIYVNINLMLGVYIYFDLCAVLAFERVKYIYLQLLKAL